MIITAQILKRLLIDSVKLTLIAMVFGSILIAQAHAQSLDDYLLEAGRSNPELRAQYNQYLASLETVPQVTALADPDLSFGYFISPIETRVGAQRARIGFNQMFPWFGTLNSRGNVASQMAQSKFEAFEESHNKLFFQVERLWFDMYRLNQSIDILKENIFILQTFENLALQRYETAQVSQVDVLRVQIEKEDLITRLALLEDSKKLQEQEFNELLNREKDTPVNRPITLEIEELSLSEEELSITIQQQNPRITRLDYEEASARTSIDVAKKNGMPSFGLGLDYIFTEERQDIMVSGSGDDAVIAKFGIKIPIWRKKYEAEKQQAQLTLRSVQDRRIAIENQLETQLEKALRDYADATRRISLYKDIQIQRTKQAIEILLEDYTASSADFEELLRLQQKLLGFQLAQETALVDQNAAVAFIQYLYGKSNVRPEDIEFKN
jgi:outer membrane protein TolC